MYPEAAVADILIVTEYQNLQQIQKLSTLLKVMITSIILGLSF
jgi:hypothetical protein